MNHNIQLFIHDSFFDSFAVLPRQIQKKTREFLRKFKENPTSSAINYEKITTFKDQRLRTVRVDDKYRAIIQQPENGPGYHLLWVDNHDQALDWAKNKIFKWNQQTHGFQLFEQPDQPALRVKHLEDSRRLFDDLTDVELLAIGTPEQMIGLVRGITSIDDLNSCKPNLPVDVFEYLFYFAEGIPLEEILLDIEAGKKEADPMQSCNTRKHTFIVTDDAQLEEVLSGSFAKWKLFLHPSQRSLAYRDYNGPVKITGGAGTGKTVCAVHRAKYLVDKADVFGKPVLFTTYTKSLAQYLERTVKELNILDHQVEIKNIDKLILDLANDPSYSIFQAKVGYFTPDQEREIWNRVLEQQPSQFDVDFFFAEYNEVILPQDVTCLEQYNTASRIGRSSRIGRKDKTEIWNVVEAFQKQKAGNYSRLELCHLLADYFRRQGEKPYSAVICDEIQDFNNPELSLLRSLVEEKENDMFLVGDPFQNIYSRAPNFARSGIVVKGRRSRKLKLNYRTTEEIKLLATNVVSNIAVDDFNGNKENLNGYLSLMHGNPPSYNVFVTPEEEENFILDKLKQLIGNSEIQPNEICISARTNAGVEDIRKFLSGANVRYLDISSNKENVNAVNVSTFHNMKGHEFKVVFLKGVSANTVPYKHANYINLSDKERNLYDQQERALYYVVFSRAVQTLVITGIGEKSKWVNVL